MHRCVGCVSKLLARYVVSQPLFWLHVLRLPDIGLLPGLAVTVHPFGHAPHGFGVCNIAVNDGLNWWASMQIMLCNPTQDFVLDGLANALLKVQRINRIKMRSDAGTFDKRAHRKFFPANIPTRAVDAEQGCCAAQHIHDRTFGPVPLGKRHTPSGLTPTFGTPGYVQR